MSSRTRALALRRVPAQAEPSNPGFTPLITLKRPGTVNATRTPSHQSGPCDMRPGRVHHIKERHISVGTCACYLIIVLVVFGVNNAIRNEQGTHQARSQLTHQRFPLPTEARARARGLPQSCLVLSAIAVQRSPVFSALVAAASLPAVQAARPWTRICGGCTFRGDRDGSPLVREGSCAADCTSLGFNGMGITQVFDTSFAGMGALNTLDLSGNELTAVLPGLSSLTALRSLELSNNKLTTVPGLSSLTMLEYVYLRSNQLTTVPDLNSLTALRTLELGGNRLTCVPLTQSRIAGLMDYSGPTVSCYTAMEAAPKPPMDAPNAAAPSPNSRKLLQGERPAKPELPAGWLAYWSDQYKMYYYYNPVAQTTQWDKPTMPSSSAPAPAPSPPSAGGHGAHDWMDGNHIIGPFTLSLPLSMAEFNDDRRAKFIETIARAVGDRLYDFGIPTIGPIDVTIVNVEAISSARSSLLASSIRIDVTVNAKILSFYPWIKGSPSGDMSRGTSIHESLWSLGQGNIIAELSKTGFPGAEPVGPSELMCSKLSAAGPICVCNLCMGVNPGRSTSWTDSSGYCCTSATSRGAGGGMSPFPYGVCLALILAAAVLGILAGCVVYPRQMASALRAAANELGAGQRDSAGVMEMRSIESGTASLLRSAEAPVDEPAEMAMHQVSHACVAVNVIPEGDAVGGTGEGVDAESTEAGPPDATPVANESTADHVEPAKGGGAAAEKEGGAAAKLEKVKKRVDSDSDDDAKPAAKGGGAAAKRAELVGLDTTKPQNAYKSAAQVDDQPQAQECGRQASAHLRADAMTWRGLETFMESLGLSKYAQVLKEQEFADLEALVLLTDENLKEMQVTIGARRKLLTAIRSLQNQHSNPCQPTPGPV